MSADNVINMEEHREPFLPPPHFKKSARATWAELVKATMPAMHVPANRFIFEITATLLTRFRSGRPQTVSEQKQLERYMASLGLTTEDVEGAAGKKKSNNGHYFE